MKVEIKIPSMGESVSEAIISQIIVESGSVVKEDDEILELETDKVNQVLHAPKSGRLTLNVSKEQTVAIGEVIGFIDTEAHTAQEPEKTPPPQKEPAEKQIATASPQFKDSARESLSDFVSSLKENPKPSVETSKPVQASSKKEGKRSRMSGLRKVIAQRLVEAKNTTAMLTTFNEIDMSTVIEIRSREKEHFLKKYGVKLGFMSFFTKAVVSALKAFPQINSIIDGDEIVTFDSYDIGIAVSTDRGLVVPVIKNCDALTFGELEGSLEQLSTKAREGSIGVDDLKGGTFTITNGGVFGSLLSTPILNIPQSAILGMHSIVKRPIVIDDKIVIRPMMYVALSYDHRLIDGREAVLFLVAIKQTLEDPSRLLLES